jgi:hypothetical protein
MQRRDFLTRIAAGATLVGRGVPMLAMTRPLDRNVHSASIGNGGNVSASTRKRHTAPSPPPKLEQIAISSWSLHNYFRATRDRAFSLPGPMLALLDLPEMMIVRYKVRHLEFCASHFPSTDPAYLQELKYALMHTLSTVVTISVDIEECGPDGTFSAPDPDGRKAALDAVKEWVDVAHNLGVKSVLVGPGKVDPENLGPTTEAYKALATYALAKGVHVMVENRAGFGAGNPEELVKLIKRVGPGRIIALPDFANFPDEPTREKGLKMLFPSAPSVCHASGLEFDVNGVETGYDFAQAMEIAKRSGFHGVYSIEFDGPGDPFAGIQKTLDELVKYL